MMHSSAARTSVSNTGASDVDWSAYLDLSGFEALEFAVGVVGGATENMEEKVVTPIVEKQRGEEAPTPSSTTGAHLSTRELDATAEGAALEATTGDGGSVALFPVLPDSREALLEAVRAVSERWKVPPTAEEHEEKEETPPVRPDASVAPREMAPEVATVEATPGDDGSVSLFLVFADREDVPHEKEARVVAGQWTPGAPPCVELLAPIMHELPSPSTMAPAAVDAPSQTPVAEDAPCDKQASKKRPRGAHCDTLVYARGEKFAARVRVFHPDDPQLWRVATVGSYFTYTDATAAGAMAAAEIERSMRKPETFGSDVADAVRRVRARPIEPASLSGAESDAEDAGEAAPPRPPPAPHVYRRAHANSYEVKVRVLDRAAGGAKRLVNFGSYRELHSAVAASQLVVERLAARGSQENFESEMAEICAAAKLAGALAGPAAVHRAAAPLAPSPLRKPVAAAPPVEPEGQAAAAGLDDVCVLPQYVYQHGNGKSFQVRMRVSLPGHPSRVRNFGTFKTLAAAGAALELVRSRVDGLESPDDLERELADIRSAAKIAAAAVVAG